MKHVTILANWVQVKTTQLVSNDVKLMQFASHKMEFVKRNMGEIIAKCQ